MIANFSNYRGPNIKNSAINTRPLPQKKIQSFVSEVISQSDEYDYKEDIIGFIYVPLVDLNPVNVKELIDKEVGKRVEEEKKKEAIKLDDMA